MSAIPRTALQIYKLFSIVAVFSLKIFNFAERKSGATTKEFKEFREFKDVPFSKFIKFPNLTKKANGQQIRLWTS